MTAAMTSTVSSTPCQPPQTMSCGLSSTSVNASRSSRPKLTLQTASVPRSFGKSNTGLSLSFVSDPTASPTVRNTFKNAYDVPVPSAPLSPVKPSVNKLCIPTARFAPSNNNSTTTTTNNNNNNNHNSPYQLPLGLKSILINSPLDASSRRRSVSMAANSANGCSGAPRRVFFPAKKHVSYRYPLEEEIQTVHFTARHSDLDAESESDPHEDDNNESVPDEDSDSSSSSNQSNSDTSTSDDDTADGVAPLSKVERKKRKIQGTERQIRAVALMDGLDGEGDAYGSSSSMTPQTPQCRTKRRREWKWTLGPLRPQYDVNDTVTTAPQHSPLASNRPMATSSVGAPDEVNEKEMTTSYDQEDSCKANNAALKTSPSTIFADFSDFGSFSIDMSARPDDETKKQS